MSTVAPSSEALATRQVPLPAAEQLPDDPATLKQMIVELVITLRQRDHDLEQARQRVHLLLQRLFGRKSERYNPHQPWLFADSAAPPEPTSTASTVSAASTTEGATEEAREASEVARRKQRGHGRRRLPDELPQRERHHELSEAERLCLCGQRRQDIGVEDGGKQLDWQPASYFVVQHWLHKYLCPCCAGRRSEARSAGPAAETGTVEPAKTEPEPTLSAAAQAAAGAPAAGAPAAGAPSARPSGPAIVTAAKPPMPIAKGLPGPGLLAHIIVSKYFDHLPLYRQEHIFERQGVVIRRSTSCDWMAACAELLRPLYQLMVQEVVRSLWLHTDDTSVQNLDHEPGTTDKARFWIYYGDRTHPYNVFDFTRNRKRDGPQTFLADFQGYLHADAFSGYDALYLPDPRPGRRSIQEVACNAHARRKFFEAKLSDELGAHTALGYYRALYELERGATANQFDDEQKLRMRQELSVPLLEQFKAWLDEHAAAVLPKSPMAEALGYARNNWAALCRYTQAGYLSIDNNVAEREMKRIAIGRKNWLFVGSANGGRTAAVLFSFTSTCHRLKIEPWAYLQDVLSRLPTTPKEQLGALLPDRWHAARKASAAGAQASAASRPPDSTR